MKKMMNLVKKRKSSSQSSDDRSTGGGRARSDTISIGRSSIASSTATSSVLQFRKSHRSPSTASQFLNLKYTIGTKGGKDKSLSKLHLAVLNEDVEKAKKYIKQGFQSEENLSANNPQPQKKLKSLLRKEENLVNSRDRFARTPLHLCASLGNEAILWALLSHGADVHAKDSDGATPLHRAVDSGHDDIARMILDRGCSLDVADVDGDTATHIGVRRGNNEIVAVLLRKGANPDIKNASGECPLHEACRLGLAATAQLLLRGGSEVNTAGPGGRTPLMIAASQPEMKVVVDSLLNYEADPLQNDQEGRNAIDFAADEDIRRMLESFAEESRQRGHGYKSSDNDFDDDADEHNNGLAKADNPYSMPFGMSDDQPVYTEMAAAVPVSDLSSWESSEDEDLQVQNKGAASLMKPSPGIMDLSKFLPPSDDEKDDPKAAHISEKTSPIESLPTQPKVREANKIELIESDGEIPSEPDRILEAVADYDSAPDDSGGSSWDSPPLSENIRPAVIMPKPLPPLPSPKVKMSPPEKPEPNLKRNPSDEQPGSLDLSKATPKRRGSRKSRSLRSTHLAMMSQPIVATIEINADQKADVQSSDSSPSFSKNENASRRRESRTSLRSLKSLQKRGSVDAMKHEFLTKLQHQSLSIDNSNEDSVPSFVMLDAELMNMEKTDLLVHIQKIQLELDQEKSKTQKGSVAEVEKNNELILKLKQDLAEKDVECRKWIAKIEQANDLANDLTAKNQTIEDLNAELEREKRQRKINDETIQIVSQRESKLLAEKRTQDIHIEELQGELLKMKSMTSSTNEELAQAKATIIELTLSMEELRSSKDRKITELSQTREEKLNTMTSELETRCQALQKELTLYKEQLTAVQDANTKMESERACAIKGQEEYQIIIGNLRQELSSLSASKELIEAQLLESSKKMRHVSSEKANLEQRVQELLTLTSLSNAKENESNNENGNLKSQIQELSVINKKCEATIESLSEEVKSLKAEIEDCLRREKEKEKELVALRETMNASHLRSLNSEELIKDLRCQLKSKTDELECLSTKHANLLLSRNEMLTKNAGDEVDISRNFQKQESEDDHEQTKTQEMLSYYEKAVGDLKALLKSKSEAYESLSAKHANLLLKKKSIDEELKRTIANQNPPLAAEVAQELASVKAELKLLHQILEEKERELLTAKFSCHESTSTNNVEMGRLKSDVIDKETKIQEVELTLEMERHKITAYEEHIDLLKDQLRDLQNQVIAATKDKSAFVARIQRNMIDSNKATSDINMELVKELKEQLRNEQEKLKAAQSKLFALEQEKASLQIELDDLMKKFMAATSDYETMKVKASTLEDELRHERLQRQLGTLRNHSRKQAWQSYVPDATSNPPTTQAQKEQALEEVIEAKDHIIRKLEENLVNVIESEALRREKEIKRCKLKYEAMARMEVNSWLAEINAFLDKRAQEKTSNDQERERISEKIQHDLASRLQQSRDELNSIKTQMKDTERGIQGLSRQLEMRERELVEERTKRRALQRHFEVKTEKRLLHDLVKKPRAAYF